MGTSPDSEESPPLTSRMRTLLWALFAPFIAIILAHELQVPFINSTGLTVNSIPYSTRLYWMKQANEALFNSSGPWYVAPEYHRANLVHSARLELSLSIILQAWINLCVEAQTITLEREVIPPLFPSLPIPDPTQHGEINAIQNCAKVLAEKRLTPSQISASFSQLSLYTVHSTSLAFHSNAYD
jgi:hypothetical protein